MIQTRNSTYVVMMMTWRIQQLGISYSPVILRSTFGNRPTNVSCRLFHKTRYQLQQQQQQQRQSDAQSKAYEYYRRKGRSNSSGGSREDRNRILASYAVAAVVGALGATYASVPLYKLFCQATGFGGTTQRLTLESNEPPGFFDQLLGMTKKRRVAGGHTWRDEEAAERLASLKPVENGRLITVRMDSTVGDVLPWTFVPTQLEVKVVPGETALSFFTATNHSPNQAITGVATYNVHPPKAGLYFSKIQCFCFEEQRLLPGETVDMPVLFFIDPDFLKDPQLSSVNNITLSYTFFQTDTDDDEEDDEVEVEERILNKNQLVGST